MSSFEEKLQEWIVCESNGLCESGMISIPEVSALQLITDGKNKKIWSYVIKRVKSKQTVRHIKNVLCVKNSQNQLNNLYPLTNKNNFVSLEQEISKANEKAEFVESSLLNMRKNIFNLKESLQFLQRRNHVLSQKCTFLEKEVSSYIKKDENLTTLYESLFLLFNSVFSTQGIKFHQDLMFQKSLEKTNKSLQPVANTIRCLLFEMSSIIKNEVLGKEDKLSCFELLESIKKIGSNVNMIGFINIMKQHLKQSEDLLKEKNIFTNSLEYQPQQNRVKTSSVYLQKMKLDHLESSFTRFKMINHLNMIASLEKIISNENRILINVENQVLIEFILVKAQNVCFEENIKYLESILSEKSQKVINIVKKNSEQKSKCANIKSVVQNFYQLLGSIHTFLEIAPKNFLDTENKLILMNNFLNFNLFSSIFQTVDDLNVCEVKNNLQLNYIGSLDLLQSKHFVKSPLNYCNLDILEIPDATCKFLEIRPFKNMHLLCEKLSHIKRKVISQQSSAKSKASEKTVPFDFESMSRYLKSKFEELKFIVEKAKKDTRVSCQGLQMFLDEWWHQEAQFIPEIVYDGKSLKMWIDILNALEDF